MTARPSSPANIGSDPVPPGTAPGAADGPPVMGGRFVLGALAGRGGMGTVYHAWDRARGVACAVKVLADALAHDDEVRARFRREAEAVLRLDHERIVRVLACGETGSRQFIAMEHVPGGTLRQLLDRGPQPERRALRIALEVAEALAYAHERGIVHRDVKPQNVLLTADGHAKVADFGIAKAADATRLTRTGSVFGSPHYIAPEQVRGDAAGPAADQYALGVVLYEALAGRVPFDGEVPVAIALRHVHDPVPSLATIRPDVSRATLEIVARLLAKAPAGRYPSTEAAAEALRGALAALPDGPGQREIEHVAPVPRGEPDTQQATTQGLLAPSDGAGETHSRASATGARPGRRGRVAVASMWAAGIVAAAAASLVLAAGYRGAWLAAHTTVPVLTGLTMQQAAREAVPLQLVVTVTGQRQDSHLPVGAIVDQTPPAGQQVLKGMVVQLTVSEGSGTVPDLRGILVSGAARELEGAGLRLGAVTYAHDDRLAVGYVMSQVQRAGTHLPANGGVDVVVSAGPNPPAAGFPQTPFPETGSANK